MVSKPCEHSGIACRPAKYAGTCDFSSLALIWPGTFWQHLCVFFGKMSRFTCFFVKKKDIDAIFWQNVAIYALFPRFRPNSQNYSQFRL